MELANVLDELLSVNADQAGSVCKCDRLLVPAFKLQLSRNPTWSRVSRMRYDRVVSIGWSKADVSLSLTKDTQSEPHDGGARASLTAKHWPIPTGWVKKNGCDSACA